MKNVEVSCYLSDGSMGAYKTPIFLFDREAWLTEHAKNLSEALALRSPFTYYGYEQCSICGSFLDMLKWDAKALAYQPRSESRLTWICPNCVLAMEGLSK